MPGKAQGGAATAIYGLSRPWYAVGLLIGPSPVAMVCPHCGNLVITRIEEHFSCATHLTACAFCVIGCWPCCVLPYCMGCCKNTFHSCPICYNLLGVYNP